MRMIGRGGKRDEKKGGGKRPVNPGREKEKRLPGRAWKVREKGSEKLSLYLKRRTVRGAAFKRKKGPWKSSYPERGVNGGKGKTLRKGKKRRVAIYERAERG